MQDQQQQQNTQMTMSQFIALVFIVCHVWSLPAMLFLRRRFGTRYIDGWLLAAALWPMIFCAFIAPQYRFGWSLWAFWGILLLGVVHRFVALFWDRQSRLRHSQFAGESALCTILPIRSPRSALVCELAAMMLGGLLCVVVSPSMMLFAFGAVAAQVIKTGLIEFYRHTELTDLRDARLEQEALANRMRDRHYF